MVEQATGNGGLLRFTHASVARGFGLSSFTSENLVGCLGESAPALLRGEELAHGGVQFVSDYFFVDDIDVLEQGLVEEAPRCVARVSLKVSSTSVIPFTCLTMKHERNLDKTSRVVEMTPAR